MEQIQLKSLGCLIVEKKIKRKTRKSSFYFPRHSFGCELLFVNDTLGTAAVAENRRGVVEPRRQQRVSISAAVSFLIPALSSLVQNLRL